MKKLLLITTFALVAGGQLFASEENNQPNFFSAGIAQYWDYKTTNFYHSDKYKAGMAVSHTIFLPTQLSYDASKGVKQLMDMGKIEKGQNIATFILLLAGVYANIELLKLIDRHSFELLGEYSQEYNHTQIASLYKLYNNTENVKITFE